MRREPAVKAAGFAGPSTNAKRSSGSSATSPFGPVSGAAHELAYRQRVEEFVGNEQQRTLGQILDSLEKNGFGRCQPVLLLDAQYRARLDQMEANGAAKFRQGIGRPQQIAGEGPAARPEFGEDHWVGPPDPLPNERAPYPDQLAENLTDLGCRDEVSAGADRPPGRVIAEFGIVERHRHIGRHRLRSLGADAAGDLVGKRAAGHGGAGRGVRRAQMMIAMPAISTGIDSS